MALESKDAQSSAVPVTRALVVSVEPDIDSHPVFTEASPPVPSASAPEPQPAVAIPMIEVSLFVICLEACCNYF